MILTTSQKAPIIVTDPSGAEIGHQFLTFAVTPEGPVSLHDQNGQKFAQGEIAGTVTLSATDGSRSGTLEIAVEDAPLTVTLGPTQPK